MQEGKLPVVDGALDMPGMVRTMRETNNAVILVRRGSSHGPLFLGFNIVLRPVQTPTFRVTIGGAARG